MVPLAWSVSLLLVLSSLSLKALALQGGNLQALQQRRRLQEDQLMVAAQQLAGQLQRRHRCLLPEADHAWGAGPCATAAEVQALRQGVAAGRGWRLLHYRPGLPVAEGGDRRQGELLLQLEGGGGTAAAFGLQWGRSGPHGLPQLLALRELGLRQGTP
jgi:hypothetical protein